MNVNDSIKKECDFIEINRSMLNIIGFKNTFCEKKDMDFNNALRCLRKTEGFLEGKSFDDNNAHFVITRHNGSGYNKRSSWIRKNMLDKWIDFVMFSGKVNLKKTKGMVYFIHQEGDLKRFNIGYTINISQRLMLIQKGTPNLLLIYKTLSNATKKTEKKLHQLLSQYRIRGEWFAIDRDMIENININK